MLQQWRVERPDLDSSGLAVVLRVGVLAGVFGERLKRILAPAGLAPWEYDVLSALRRASAREGVSPGELCRSAQLTSGAMTHRLDRLEERGLVRRRAAPRDGRGVRVRLTPRGRQLVDSILGARMADAGDSLGALSRRDARELTRLLRALCGGLEEPAAAETP